VDTGFRNRLREPGETSATPKVGTGYRMEARKTNDGEPDIMNDPRRYGGIHNDEGGGMSPTAKIVRDAWAFGLIPEDETCEGWMVHQIEALWEKVNAEWEKYGFRVGAMPQELQERYMALQKTAMARARAQGWSGAQELEDDS